MRRWMKRTVIVLVVFVLPPATFYFYSTWQGERELRAVLAELDAEETAWRWEDLIAARPKLDPDKDLRVLIQNINRSVPRSFLTNWKITDAALAGPPNVAIAPDCWDPFKELMLTVQSSVAEAFKINRLGAVRYQCIWPANVAATNLDEVSKLRSFIYLMQCAAAWHAKVGDLDAAMDDCLVMQRICQSLEDEPTLIVHLIRIAMQALAGHASQSVVAQGQPKSMHLERLQKAWETFDRERALVNGLRGERAYCHRMFEAFADGRLSLLDHPGMLMPKGAELPLAERATIFYRANLTRAHAWSLRHLTAQMEALNLSEPQRAARQRELAQEALNAPGVARLLTSSVPKLLEAHRRAEANVRCLIVGLAAERFRRVHDRWPKTLGELCPKFLTKVPDDPYSSTSLQLRVAPDGIVIYSVGPDGKRSGMYQDDLAAKVPITLTNLAYEFRLWNVNQRRLVDHRQP